MKAGSSRINVVNLLFWRHLDAIALQANLIMDIPPIRTESDYLAALKTVEPYFDSEPDPASEAGEHFEILLALTQAYEARHHPVDPPDPIEAIKFRMEQQGLTPKDLAPMIGRPNRVYGLIEASVESRLT